MNLSYLKDVLVSLYENVVVSIKYMFGFEKRKRSHPS
jgi:hypothetical protein